MSKMEWLAKCLSTSSSRYMRRMVWYTNNTKLKFMDMIVKQAPRSSSRYCIGPIYKCCSDGAVKQKLLGAER